MTVSIYIPTNSASVYPHPLLFVDFLMRCEVVLHCSLDLHFFNKRYWASFHVCLSHLYVFFGEMSVYIFFPLFNWVVFLELSSMSCLYILEINPLSVVWFAVISSRSECCLFTFLIVSFAVQKRLSLIRSHLFTFWEGNRQEGQGSPNGRNSLQVSDIFISQAAGGN